MSDTGIEVRIRNYMDADAVHFATVGWDQLDSVIPTIRSWGLYTDDLSENEVELSGSFRFGASGAFFEVIVHEADVPT